MNHSLAGDDVLYKLKGSKPTLPATQLKTVNTNTKKTKQMKTSACHISSLLTRELFFFISGSKNYVV